MNVWSLAPGFVKTVTALTQLGGTNVFVTMVTDSTRTESTVQVKVVEEEKRGDY